MGTLGKYLQCHSFLIRRCRDPQVIFEIKYFVLDLTKCHRSRNVRDHLAIDIKYVKDITYNET